MTTKTFRRVALAYSGGLDTSIIVPWLKEKYGCDVVAFCADVGQGDELSDLHERALRIGADQVILEDLRETFLVDYVFPALKAGAMYEGRYLLGTALARPLIAARQVACAKATGCDALAHGCTGKGNDQVRFELTAMALAPDLPILAPWREWDITSREDALAYAARHGIPVKQTKGDLYSRDANLWHLSHEGGVLEDPANAPPESLHKLTAAPSARPAVPETIDVTFTAGVPTALDGVTLDPVTLVERLNEVAGRHGVGRADLVESRLVGMKSRGVYETPAGTALYEALEDLARLVLPHDLHRTRATLALTYADLIYNGLWFSPLRRSIAAFMDEAMAMATGTVTLEFLQGNVRAIARTSPNSLYDTALASFDMTGYRPKDAEGFIRLFGLPMAAASRQCANVAAPVAPVSEEGYVDVAG
jgi:argininosuccinate synthase